MIRSISAGLLITLAAFLMLLALQPGPSIGGETICGKASWYGNEHEGRKTASGATFRQWGMTAAHLTLPFGSKVRVTHGDKSVVVTINDRGGFGKYGRILDLSRGAFAKLAPTRKGVIRVCMERR